MRRCLREPGVGPHPKAHLDIQDRIFQSRPPGRLFVPVIAPRQSSLTPGQRKRAIARPARKGRSNRAEKREIWRKDPAGAGLHQRVLKHGIARPCKHAGDSVVLGDKPDASKCRLTPEHRYSFLDDKFRNYAFIGRRASSDGR